MPVWSLKRRILLLIIAVLGSAVILLAAYFVDTRGRMLEEHLLDRGVITTQQLALMSQLAWRQSNSREVLEELATLSIEEQAVRSTTIYIADVGEAIHSGPKMLSIVEENTAASRGEVVVSKTRESVRFVRPIVVESEGGLQSVDIGWVEIEFADHPLIINMFRTMLSSGTIVLFVLIAMVSLALLLTNRYKHKLDKVLHAVDRASEESLAVEIPLDGDNDELELLASRLNRMWQKIYVEQKESERSAAQTTRDLRETLETLEVQNIELDLARKEAVNASHVKSEFLANTSHEIRTPLNGIIGFTNLMMKTNLTDKQVDYVTTIRQSANGLLRIINDILDFSKIEAGKLVLDYIAINLYDLLEETTNLMAPVIGEKNITLSIVYQHDAPEYITGDPQRLQQIMTNLVHNAIKFTDAGEVQIHVQLLENREIELSVSDTGIGMSDEQQHNLFSAFSQGDRSVSRNYGGTGLGLVIAQRLVEQMGSSIDLRSEPGEGSTFRFQLKTNPVTQDDSLSKLDGVSVCFHHPIPGISEALQELFYRWQLSARAYPSMEKLLENCTDPEPEDDVIALLGVDSECLENTALMDGLHSLAEGRRLILLSERELQNALQAKFPEQTVRLLSTPLRRQQLHANLGALLHKDDAREYSQGQTLQAVVAKRTSKRLLIVDDNPANLKLLRLMLEHEGLQCQPVSSGAEAIAACDQETFEMIFMDIQMPEISGLEAAQAIRSDSRLNKATPVIAVTAHAQTDDKNAFLRAGMNDYLGKPILEEQLRAILQKWCQTKPATEASSTDPAVSQGFATAAVEIATPVDLKLCHSLASNKADIAQDMLAALLDSLPKTREEIIQHCRSGDLQGYHEAVHKLHGLACYTGVPQLKEICNDIESQIKLGAHEQAMQLAERLDVEIERLREWHEQHDLDVLFEA